MPVTDALVGELVAVGLTRNEAVAYVTLLESEGAVTGYEVAQRSGIPRSAVYSVLRRLEEAGGAFLAGADPARYVACDPVRFVTAMRSAATQRFDRVADALSRVPKHSQPEPVWILDRYEDVMARIETMIRGAESSIHLSLWPREVEHLWAALTEAGRRPLHKVLFSPDHLRRCPEGWSCWCGSTERDAPKAGWSHKARVVTDRREALIGGTEPDALNRAVWTGNPSLVDVAADALILDITLLGARSGRDCTPDVAPMMRPHLSPRASPTKSSRGKDVA